MKTRIILVVISFVMISCSKKVPYQKWMSDKLEKKEKEGKVWFFLNPGTDLLLTYTGSGEPDLDVDKKGRVEVSAHDTTDNFFVAVNKTGGMMSKKQNTLSIRFDKDEAQRLLPFKSDTVSPNSLFYLDVVIGRQQVLVWKSGYYYWLGCYQYYQPPYQTWEPRDIYYVKMKGSDGQERWYVASARPCLYVKKKDVGRPTNTTKTASGYKPK